jgi:hypothetical protein
VQPGLDVLVGGLLERRGVPELDAPRDRDWLDLTGIANDAVESPGWQLSPRVGATWDVLDDGRWTLDVAAGTYYDRFDPLLIAQWRYDGFGARVRRVVGGVSWPTPGGGGAPQRTLTVLGDGFDAPRTARVTAGLSHRLGARTVIDVRAVTRRTEGLPRRRDLNVLPLPSAHDQYGRALYGTLTKQGALLAALPGTGRRFAGYDEVVGVAADGWSRQRGVTVGVEHALEGGLSLRGGYSFGRTTDNWFGGDWTETPPAGFEGADWLEARSDFDAPHRVVAAAVLEPASVAGLRLAAFYRYTSGRTFTPGFRAGVDANGDGEFGNDPAFVDAALPGMSALMAAWSCLGDAAGRFVERNACRADGVHAADARAEWRAARLGRGAATLTLEVFNLFDTAPAVPDAALYVLDPAADLTSDTAARRVTVPLLVNPSFGEPLQYPQPGRLLRVGLSLTW